MSNGLDSVLLPILSPHVVTVRRRRVPGERMRAIEYPTRRMIVGKSLATLAHF